MSQDLTSRRPSGARDRIEAPRVLCLGHSMKETLGVKLAAKALDLGLQMGGGVSAGTFCISDGGDGFLDAMGAIVGGGRQRVVTRDPLGRLHMADYLLNSLTATAVIETALVCGLNLVPPADRNIMISSSRGVADLLMHAVACGARRIYVGLGGSATCDGGLGMLRRLEGALLDNSSTNFSFGADSLPGVKALNLQMIRDRLEGVEIIGCCDVRNPLLGEYGTATVYAPQKGASPEEIQRLEAGLTRWAEVLESTAHRQLRHIPGAGAAGGLGFALAALGAKLEGGADFVCQQIGLEERLKNSRGLLTCEGRFDESSFNGKAPWVASQYAVAAGRRAVLLCGVASPSAAKRAAEDGVTVVEVGRNMDEAKPRSPETFIRLERAVALLVRSFE